MADSLGPISVPDAPVIPAFPFAGEFGSGIDYAPTVATHVFDQPGLKTEQRYLLGGGARRFRVSRARLACQDIEQLRSHFTQAQGSYAQFPYTFYTPSGPQTVTARYENPSLSFDHLIGMMASDPGITLLEIPPTPAPYTSVASVTRFPDATLTSALESQVQELIPLVTISPRDGSAPAYVSTRRCTVDGQLYLARVADWRGIAQSIGEMSDSASFTMGNADGIWTQLANTVNLQRALVQFRLFHVQSNYLIKFWSGYARPWTVTSDGKFVIPASDGVFELTLAYPVRNITRTCWKKYKGRYCPSTSSLPDCPKSWQACNDRGVPLSFGGVVALPQTVRVKDNSTGTLGFGRSTITSVSIADDSVYDRPVQEVYTDVPMKVNCDVAMGRDQGDFYSAVGIVGEGPIGAYSDNLLTQLLDNQPPENPRFFGGWRGVHGNDPADPAYDFFGLNQSPWNVVPPDSTYAAGLAFAEIIRTDAAGLQLSEVTDRSMTVTVDEGIGGWTWTGPGARNWTAPLSNPVWVAVNVYLRAIGLRVDSTRAAAVSPAEMEKYFDVDAAMEAAGICEILVPKLIGDTSAMESQFKFRGVLKEKKPLKDWLQEILNCCLGYYTFVDGKLWIGIRENSSVLAGNAFTRATILYQSLQTSPVQPGFNYLTGQFGDEEYEFALNNVTIYDSDQAELAGSSDSPQYNQSSMSFVGIGGKSQCARVITTRLREEIGGVGPTEQLNARNMAFRTTLLAMRTQVGDIASLSHDTLPTGYMEGRVVNWTLNPDFSIDIQTTCTYDDMYDLDAGPKPDDVGAPPVPPELLQSPTGLAWMPNEIGPSAGDPVYQPWERTFDLWQEYEISKDGVWVPTIWVQGKMCVNQFASQTQPRIVDIELAAGGTLAGPMTVYAAVTQRDAAGESSFPSNLSGIWIAQGVSGQKAVLTVVPSPDAALTGYDVWAGTDRRQIAWQSGGSGAPPATIEIAGPIHNMTMGLPEGAATGVKIQAKHVFHAGIAGALINSVPSSNQIQCNDFAHSTDNWVGQLVFIASNVAGDVPLWNFRVIAFSPSDGTLTVTPNCTGVAAGDVLIVYAQPTAADANSITNTRWDNSVNRQQFPGSAGMNPDEEKGRIVRILRGTGAGQMRYCTGNSAFTHQIQPPWDVIPDATSIYIVEAPDWQDPSITSALDAPTPDVSIQMHTEVPNLSDEIVLVGGFLVDDNGHQTDDGFACYRMIYVFGQPPTVLTVAAAQSPYNVAVTDQVIRGDSSTSDITLVLLPLADYQGRGLLVANLGPGSTIINTTAPDKFPDGTSTLIISTTGGTARITAGGLYTA